MSRGMFGWSYPPGAASDPNAPYNQEDPPCEVCGKHVDDCICPVCLSCGCQGDPKCYANGDFDGAYNGHGLILTPEQTAARAAAQMAAAETDAYFDELARDAERMEAEQAAQEQEYYAAHLLPDVDPDQKG